MFMVTYSTTDSKCIDKVQYCNSLTLEPRLINEEKTFYKNVCNLNSKTMGRQG